MTVEIMIGDATERLKELPDQSVQCVITSPPYFGLRDYGVEGQLGTEPTPREFAEAITTIFREVWRVLRDDGTVWLNLGDSYATQGVGAARVLEADAGDKGNRTAPAGLKQKDLIGIPWRVAFALQDDGWYLRQDIIWHKPNPMPESVRDRCTKAHEYLFMLTKSPKYYFDNEAIKEPEAMKPQRRNTPRSKNPDSKYHGQPVHRRPEGGTGGGLRNKRSVWTVSTKPYKGAHFATFPPDLIEPCVLASSRPGDMVLDPFAGSGTTGAVAHQHERDAVLIDLNPEYEQLMRDRIGL